MAAPATPANLSIDAIGSNAVYLSWDNVAGETSFKLYRSEDDITYKLVGTIDADTLTYWDKYIIVVSTLYYYKISALNADGESALSASVNDTTLAEDLKDNFIGSSGNFKYDENALVPDTGENRRAIFTSGRIRALLGPAIGTDVVRDDDLLITAEDYKRYILLVRGT